MAGTTGTIHGTMATIAGDGIPGIIATMVGAIPGIPGMVTGTAGMAGTPVGMVAAVSPMVAPLAQETMAMWLTTRQCRQA